VAEGSQRLLAEWVVVINRKR